MLQSNADAIPTTERPDPAARDDRWVILAMLGIGYGLYNLDKSIISIIIEPLKREFGLSDSQIGALSGFVQAVPFALCCIPVGMLADRMSRKKLLAILVAGWSGMTALGGFVVSAWQLFVARAGIGVFESGYSPASMSLLSDSFPRKQRATAMGIFALGAPFGLFLGLAIGGLVAATHGWRAALWVAGAPGLLLGMVMLVAFREPERGRYDDEKDKIVPARLGEALRHAWRNRIVFNVGCGMTTGGIVLGVFSVWTPSLLIRVHGFDVREAGLASAMTVGLFGAVGAAVGGFVSDSMGKRKESWRMLPPLIGLVLSMLSLWGACFTHSDALTLVLLATAAFFGQFFMGPGYSAANSYSPVSMRGTTMAIFLISFNLISHASGAMVVGSLSDMLHPEFGSRSIAVGMAIAGLFSLVAALFFWRAMRQMTREALTA